jgi:hypothetical protein
VDLKFFTFTTYMFEHERQVLDALSFIPSFKDSAQVPSHLCSNLNERMTAVSLERLTYTAHVLELVGGSSGFRQSPLQDEQASQESKSKQDHLAWLELR